MGLSKRTGEFTSSFIAGAQSPLRMGGGNLGRPECGRFDNSASGGFEGKAKFGKRGGPGIPGLAAVSIPEFGLKSIGFIYHGLL